MVLQSSLFLIKVWWGKSRVGPSTACNLHSTWYFSPYSWDFVRYAPRVLGTPQTHGHLPRQACQPWLTWREMWQLGVRLRIARTGGTQASSSWYVASLLRLRLCLIKINVKKKKKVTKFLAFMIKLRNPKYVGKENGAVSRKCFLWMSSVQEISSLTTSAKNVSFALVAF